MVQFVPDVNPPDVKNFDVVTKRLDAAPSDLQGMFVDATEAYPA